MLTQTRPGARGALLCHAAIPLAEFGSSWPDGVPLQTHTMVRTTSSATSTWRASS